MEQISDSFSLKTDRLKDPLFTFQTLLFHSWAIRKLNLECRFAPLSVEQARGFFTLIRGKEVAPPFTLKDYKEIFLGDCISLVQDIGPDEKALLKDTLTGLWKEFTEEYAMVDTSALDPRFTKYIIIGTGKDN
jgi:hypothetical protein